MYVLVRVPVTNASVGQGNSVDVEYYLQRFGFAGTVTLVADAGPTDVTVSYPLGQIYTGSVERLLVRYTASAAAPTVSLFATTVVFSGSSIQDVTKTGTLSVVSASLSDSYAELPRVVPDIDVAAFRAYSSGTLYTPATAAALATALSACARGDRIQLTAGVDYNSTVNQQVLAAKAGTPDKDDPSTFIHIYTANRASLPAISERVNPTDHLAHMPLFRQKLNSGNPCVKMALGADGYFLDGIAWDGGTTTSSSRTLELGDFSSATTATDLPDWVVVNQCIGTTTLSNQSTKCLSISGTNMVVRDSHIASGGHSGQDDQGIGSPLGVGPFHIVNNFIQGGAENLMFGGANAGLKGQNPEDITIRRNHFYKPLTWNTAGGTWDGNTRAIKNSFELKQGNRVLFEDNLIENYWIAAQNYCINLKSNDNGPNDPTIQTANVTVRYNRLKNVASFISLTQITDTSGLDPVPASRFSVHDNEVSGIADPLLLANPIVAVAQLKTSYIDFSNNTCVPVATNAIAMVSCTPTAIEPYDPLIFSNNIIPRMNAGYKADSIAEGTASLNHSYPVYTFLNNCLIGNPTLANYPATTTKVANVATIAFENAASADYRLSASSPLLGTGSGGSDPGADIDAINTRTAGCVTGVWA